MSVAPGPRNGPADDSPPGGGHDHGDHAPRLVRARGRPGAAMKRLLIGAHAALVVHAIRRALRQTTGFEVVGMLDGRTSLRTRLRELRPGVVVVDDMRDPAHAPGRLREVAEELPDAMAILLAAGMEGERTDEAFEAGAEAVVSKGMHA